MSSELLSCLLSPLSDDLPAGEDLAYSQEFDAIREARKGDDPSLAQGEWVTQLRSPQWSAVKDQCEALLRERTKDLQVAVWYTDALSRLEGFQGLAFGLQVVQGILDDYWATAYPKGDDLDERISRIEWLANQLPLVLESTPMVKGQEGYSYLKWEESQQVENLGLRDNSAKEAAVAEGKLSGDLFDRAVKQSGAGFYQALDRDIGLCLEASQKLQSSLDQHFGSNGPDLLEVRKALENGRTLCRKCLTAFPNAPAVQTGTDKGADSPAAGFQNPGLAMVEESSRALATRQEAVARLREVAGYFRTFEPHSPVAPLVERAARWAEMPLEAWLGSVIKDESTLYKLRELLEFAPPEHN